ncbi:methylenetetrahydrofolate reductase C-terminal domain-containing protein [Thalassospiraceae bacterium LMO-JJ14]|nr:methylenetetrahydrofolate reductase C-terminal domain-containing protein [Thalassospiraceae bacterium LMO-JJ14]
MSKQPAPSTAYQPSGTSTVRRQRARYSIRLWSVRRARAFEVVYNLLADVFLKLHPLWNMIGYSRVERPVIFVEKAVKSFLFDCRMCGQCALSDTGMSCPMNCPKQLRNGPCGGVRANGNCEVEPDMPCVWVQAWQGSQRMHASSNIFKVQKPVDQSLRDSSAWLRVTAQKAAERRAAAETGQ